MSVSEILKIAHLVVSCFILGVVLTGSYVFAATFGLVGAALILLAIRAEN